MNSKIENLVIEANVVILEALRQMDIEKVKTLFVYNDNRFVGLLTLGDIQRAIIKNVTLTEPVSRILDCNKLYGYKSESADIIKEKMLRLRAECMPV